LFTPFPVRLVTRLQIPTLRVCPADVLRSIREVVETAELVYLGDAQWVLGDVQKSNTRERLGRYKMQRAGGAKVRTPRDFARWRYVRWEGELLCQGFSPINVFAQNDPDGRITEYLRVREYQWRANLDAGLRSVFYDGMHETEQLAAEREDEAELDALAQKTPLLDEKRLREAWRWGFHRPVSALISQKPASMDRTSPITHIDRRSAKSA
jgi:hypothetical protein